MDRIGLQVPLFDQALFVAGQLAEHSAQVLPQVPIQHLAPILRKKDDVIFALPFGMA
jgi:hypothetical protein